MRAILPCAVDATAFFRLCAQKLGHERFNLMRGNVNSQLKTVKGTCSATETLFLVEFSRKATTKEQTIFVKSLFTWNAFV